MRANHRNIAEANKEIGEHENASAALEERMAALRAQIQHLCKEQDRHKEAIHQCKGVVTLARRMPEELLSKICEHCVEDGWTRALIVVSHVWRSAAHAPRVWSHVYVLCRLDMLPLTRYALAMPRQAPLDITLVAIRSRQVPLDLTLIATHEPNWQVTASVELLLQHVSRCRTLAIEADSISRLNTLVSRITCAAAISLDLQELTIETAHNSSDTGEDIEAADKSLAEAFTVETAPRLMSLRYTATAIPLNPIPAHLRELRLTVDRTPGGLLP